MRSLCCIAFLIACAGSLVAEPLTEEQAQAYVRERPDAAAADILKLEAIERAVPVVAAPALVVLLTRDEIYAYWDPDVPMVVEIAGALKYEISLPTARAKRSRPPPWGYVLVGSLGATAGLVAGALLAR